jgi:hypothetical protein
VISSPCGLIFGDLVFASFGHFDHLAITADLRADEVDLRLSTSVRTTFQKILRIKSFPPPGRPFSGPRPKEHGLGPKDVFSGFDKVHATKDEF